MTILGVTNSVGHGPLGNLPLRQLSGVEQLSGGVWDRSPCRAAKKMHGKKLMCFGFPIPFGGIRASHLTLDECREDAHRPLEGIGKRPATVDEVDETVRDEEEERDRNLSCQPGELGQRENIIKQPFESSTR